MAMCSWVTVDCTKTPTVNETCKHATGSFYLKGGGRKVSKDLCSSGCKTQAVGSSITTDWLSSTTGRSGLSIPEQSRAAQQTVTLGGKKKKLKKSLFLPQTSSVHSAQPERPLSVLQSAELEEAAEPMHSAPSIVYHHS